MAYRLRTTKQLRAGVYALLEEVNLLFVKKSVER